MNLLNTLKHKALFVSFVSAVVTAFYNSDFIYIISLLSLAFAFRMDYVEAQAY